MGRSGAGISSSHSMITLPIVIRTGGGEVAVIADGDAFGEALTLGAEARAAGRTEVSTFTSAKDCDGRSLLSGDTGTGERCCDVVSGDTMSAFVAGVAKSDTRGASLCTWLGASTRSTCRVDTGMAHASATTFIPLSRLAGRATDSTAVD
jgi:hypothetical protein